MREGVAVIIVTQNQMRNPLYLHLNRGGGGVVVVAQEVAKTPTLTFGVREGWWQLVVGETRPLLMFEATEG